MKHDPKARIITFGDLISGLYHACGSRRAVAIIRLAVNAHLLAIPRIRQGLSEIAKNVSTESVQ